jgi:hypothetical protein
MKILFAIVILCVSCYIHAYPTFETDMKKGEISRENIKKLLDELNISVPSDLLPRVRRNDKSNESSKMKRKNPLKISAD